MGCKRVFCIRRGSVPAMGVVVLALFVTWANLGAVAQDDSLYFLAVSAEDGEPISQAEQDMLARFAQALIEGSDEGYLVRPSDHFNRKGAERDHVGLEDNAVVLRPGDAGGRVRNGYFMSPPLKVPAFNSIYLAYDRDTPEGTSAKTEIRILKPDGSWSDWIEVDQDSELVFKDEVSQIQYRVNLMGNGSATPSFRNFSFVTERGYWEDEPWDRLDSVDRPVSGIVERDQWGAAPASRDTGKMGSPHSIIVHHTAGPAKSFRGPETMKQIQKFHKGRSWADIGYHFVIDPRDGTIYRGREEHLSGAHCPPNTGRFGVCVAGNYENDKLSSAARASLVNLLAHLCGKHGIPTSRIWGHNERGSTACPGRDIKNQLGEIKAETSRTLGR